MRGGGGGVDGVSGDVRVGVRVCVCVYIRNELCWWFLCNIQFGDWFC